MAVPAFRATPADTAPTPPGPDAPVIVRSARCVTNPFVRLRAVWQYRELLLNLVRKDLKVKYKNSVLGFAWSLLNPLLYLTVFYVVFQIVLGAGIANFQIFLLCGVLSWNLFTASVSGATSSIAANAPLVTKVWFPRELLPLAAIGAAMVNFVLQAVVLGVGMVAFRWSPDLALLPLLVPATVAAVLFATVLALLLSAVNVKFRDTQHFLELGLVAWFWLTPVVYPYMQLASRLGGKSAILLLNPMTSVVLVFQRVIYNPAGNGVNDPPILPDVSSWWYLRNVLLVTLAAFGLLLVALAIFGRRGAEFAESI
jgi:ABC-2 type transport system permease protein